MTEQSVKNTDENMDKMANENEGKEVVEEEEEDIFKGPLEEYKEIEYFGKKDFYTDEKDKEGAEATELEITSAMVKNKRSQLYKYVISRQKREFEAHNPFNDKEPGAEGSNLDIKPTKPTEFATTERAILEIELQTANDSSEKLYQVPKVRNQNSFTNTEEDINEVMERYKAKASTYLTNDQQLQKLESFLYKVRSRMEEALQSNETIDIFQNDFDLDRTEKGFDQTGEKKNEKTAEPRTFRDNVYAGEKTKREKSINYIKFLRADEEYVAHTYFRNLPFEDRIKIIGIPQQAHILFWNFLDREINSPVYVLDVPMELSCFDINPSNVNQIIGGMISGQLIIIEVKDLLGNLRKSVPRKEQYSYYINLIADAHKTHITAMKWFDKGIVIHKYNLSESTTNKNDVTVLATIAEDGQILIWDFKGLDRSIKNDTSNCIKPIIKTEVNKMDSLSKICGTGLNIQYVKKQFYVSTDEGQIYIVDWTAKVSPENMTGNIKKVLSNRYFRPIIAFQGSPFWDNIFLTVHDFHFCIWEENRSKPIFQSPNLKSSSYTYGRFSPSRPSVLYITRNNGSIDIWDFLDESHKPSVKESFIKENITFLDIFRYSPNTDDYILGGSTTKKVTEYFCIGDSSGQMTIMEVPKLFSEAATDEKKLMWEILENEIRRQEDMDLRYKNLDEEQYKATDEFSEEPTLHDPSKESTNLDEKEKEAKDLKDLEDAYQAEIYKIMEEIPQEEDEDI